MVVWWWWGGGAERTEGANTGGAERTEDQTPLLWGRHASLAKLLADLEASLRCDYGRHQCAPPSRGREELGAPLLRLVAAAVP